VIHLGQGGEGRGDDGCRVVAVHGMAGSGDDLEREIGFARVEALEELDSEQRLSFRVGAEHVDRDV
jgi:hypothetical protein